MKYCLTNEDRSTGCCYEFQKGKFRGHWQDSSVYMDFDVFNQLGLDGIFLRSLANFFWDGITEVSAEEWKNIKASASGAALEALLEIESFLGIDGKNEIITVLGV